MVKQRRNVEGRMITAAGRMDQRAFNTQPQQPTHTFETLHKPESSQPWQVWGTEIATGKRHRVGRYTTERAAKRREERSRQEGPNFTPSRKMLHSLGIDQRR